MKRMERVWVKERWRGEHFEWGRGEVKKERKKAGKRDAE